MNLRDYIWNIYEIAKTNNVQRDVAKDMFIANLNAGTDRYKGATGVSYRRLGLRWKALSDTEKRKQQNEFHDIITDYFKPLSQAWQAGDRKAFDAVIAGIK